MIPSFDVAQAALAPYLMWVKIGLFALVVAAAGLFAWRVNAWHHGYLERDAAVAQEKATRAQAAQTLAQLQTRFDNAQKASQEFQNDVSKIRAERDRLRNLPARTVRVCVAGPAVQAAGPGPRRSDGAAPGPTPQPATAGPDIGRDLYGIADDADQREAELAAQIVKLQGLLAGH